MLKITADVWGRTIQRPNSPRSRRLGLLFLCWFVVFAATIPTEISAQPTPPKPTKPPATPQGFVPPKLLQFVQAPYPKEALKARKVGAVLLQLIVDATGKVLKATVAESAGAEFDQAALAAVQRFVFQPATFKGKPVPVRIAYRYRFTLRTIAVSRPATRPKAASLPTTKAALPPPRRAIEAKVTDSAGASVVRGFLRERGTRRPIEGAPVYLIGRKRYQAITDPEGAFTIPNVRPGRYRFVAPVPNFEKLRQTVTVARKKTLDLQVYLRSNAEGLFQSVTRAKRQRLEIHQQSLQEEEIRLAPGTQGDPLKVVQNLPGVARTPLNAGAFIVRGSAPGDTRTYLDGHQIPQLYHFGGLTAVVNGDMAQRLDFIPGGFSVAYGRGMGGVIHLQTRPGKDRFHGYVDLDIIDVGVFLEGPLWKGATFIASFRRSHLDLFLNLILPQNRAFDLTVAPRYYDYQFKIDWNVDRHNRLTLMYFGSGDKLSFLRSEPVGRSDIRGDFLFYTAFHRLNFSWAFRLGKTFEHDLAVQIGTTSTDTKGGDQFAFQIFEPVLSIRDEMRWTPFKQLMVRAGLDMRLRYEEQRFEAPPATPRVGDGNTGGTNLLRDLKQNLLSAWIPEPALYMEVAWMPIPSLRIVPGVRVDFFGRTKEFTFDPRFNVAWDPIKSLTLKASVGLFSQPASGLNSSEMFGNPDIRAEKAMHYVLGAEMRWTDFFSTEINGYYKELNGLVVSSSDVVVRNGQEVPERVTNKGQGRAYGVEVLIRHKPVGKFFGWISYTLGRSERLNRTTQEWELFNFDQTHILTLLGAYKIGWGLTLSARFRLVSGNPYTPFTGGIYNADSFSYLPIRGKTNSARAELFHQLDLRLDYEYAFLTWKLIFYLDVQNVYYQLNQEGRINNYDYTQQAPLTGIPILPSIGIKAQF